MTNQVLYVDLCLNIWMNFDCVHVILSDVWWVEGESRVTTFTWFEHYILFNQLRFVFYGHGRTSAKKFSSSWNVVSRLQPVGTIRLINNEADVKPRDTMNGEGGWMAATFHYAAQTKKHDLRPLYNALYGSQLFQRSPFTLFELTPRHSTCGSSPEAIEIIQERGQMVANTWEFFFLSTTESLSLSLWPSLCSFILTHLLVEMFGSNWSFHGD